MWSLRSRNWLTAGIIRIIRKHGNAGVRQCTHTQTRIQKWLQFGGPRCESSIQNLGYEQLTDFLLRFPDRPVFHAFGHVIVVQKMMVHHHKSRDSDSNIWNEMRFRQVKTVSKCCTPSAELVPAHMMMCSVPGRLIYYQVVMDLTSRLCMPPPAKKLHMFLSTP